MDWSTRDIPAFVYADTTWKSENLAVTREVRRNSLAVGLTMWELRVYAVEVGGNRSSTYPLTCTAQ